MRVSSAVAVIPDKRPVTEMRAEQRCNDYWFLRTTGARDLIPAVEGAAQKSAYQPPSDAEVCVAGPVSAVDQLAVEAASRLKQVAGTAALRKTDAVIVCSTGIESQFGVSLAGKLQHILEATKAFPFAVGQMDGCSAFAALQIARALMQGPERAQSVAIIASDCWLYPYFRSYGDYAQYADGAAAVLLTPGSGENTNEIRIGDIAVARYPLQKGPFDKQETPWFKSKAWPEAVGSFLRKFLRDRGLTPSDIGRIHSPALGGEFTSVVARTSGLAIASGDGGVMSASGPLLAFQDGDECAPVNLCWSAGLNGEMGACLYHGPSLERGSTDHA